MLLRKDTRTRKGKQDMHDEELEIDAYWHSQMAKQRKEACRQAVDAFMDRLYVWVWKFFFVLVWSLVMLILILNGVEIIVARELHKATHPEAAEINVEVETGVVEQSDSVGKERQL